MDAVRNGTRKTGFVNQDCGKWMDGSRAPSSFVIEVQRASTSASPGMPHMVQKGGGGARS